MRLLLIISTVISLAYSQRSELKYTDPARTVHGEKCLGGCIQDYCIVNRQGEKQPCEALNYFPVIYYTARLRHPTYKRCLSNCGNFNEDSQNSWCYVNEAKDWDYCNPNREPTANTRENLPATYPMTIAYPENEIITHCIRKCQYKPSASRNVCKVSRKNVQPCAPFATSVIPHLNRPYNYYTEIDSSYPSCNIVLGKKLCRVKRDSDDSDSEEACQATAAPAYSNIYMESNETRGISSLPAGTVMADALAFESLGNTTNVDPNQAHLNPITFYTTVEIPGFVNLSLPTVVRARITREIIESVGPRRPLKLVVPELTSALQQINRREGLPYDVGHMVAHQNGGPDEMYNLAPQVRLLNRGAWKKMESNINTWALNNPDGWIDMVIVVYYDTQDTYLPIAFGVNLAFYYAYRALATDCRDLLFWNKRPDPRLG